MNSTAVIPERKHDVWQPVHVRQLTLECRKNTTSMSKVKEIPCMPTQTLKILNFMSNGLNYMFIAQFWKINTVGYSLKLSNIISILTT